MNEKFISKFEVRDYECDLQEIVNNANYMHYLEHARHLFLKSIDLDFAELNKLGKLLVVTEANLKYKTPLKSGMKFYIESEFTMPSPVRFCFQQKIFIETETNPILSLEALIIGACLDASKNKPCKMDFITSKLAAFN